MGFAFFVLESIRRTPNGWRILAWGMWMASLVALVQWGLELK